jgi:site-specific recombinase XerD
MEMAVQIEEFLAEKRRNKATATYDQYRVVLQTIFLRWCAGEITEPGLMTDKAMIRFSDYLRTRTHNGKPLSISTVRTYLRTVRIFLNWCGIAKGRFEQPRQPRRLIATLTRREIDLLERVADSERDRLMVRVLGDTGIRVSELLGLALGDLRENSHDRRYMIQVIGKGDKQREVAVSAAVFDRLKALGKSGGFIFKNQVGGSLDRHKLAKLIHQLGMKAKIDRRVWPHLFRHSYASYMLVKGVNPVVLQKTLGHESLAMISQTYSHILAEDSYDTLMNALK